MSKYPRFPLITLLLLCLTLSSAISRVNAADIDLPQVQAAYFFNFIKFVTWPEDHSNAPLVIRTYKSPAIAEALKNAPQKSVHDRPLDVKDVQAPQALLDADAVFIPREHVQSIPEDVWKQLRANTSLVVSDWDRILDKGGTIRLMTVDGKLRFAISLRHVADLAISSKLLRLASDVQK